MELEIDLQIELEVELVLVLVLGLVLVLRGIGVFFYTRKGQFLYKISSYIILYHVAIMIYHCVSSPVS